MKTHLHHRAAWLAVLRVSLLLALPASVMGAAPDLTAPGVIATIDKTLTYNLGPTGLRGWIYNSEGSGADGTMSALSRQILITVVGSGTPAAGVLAANDVILGVGWGTGSDPVAPFTSDARKSFGAAIGEAEKSENSGILKLKRWRASVTEDVSITLAVMDSYTGTAPYACPKSANVLANARNLLVSQLLANPSFLSNNYGGAIEGLALLAGVAPGDPNYAAVQTRLQTFARSLATTGPQEQSLKIWNWGYIGVFLGEYYLSTGDTSVLDGINNYTVALAKAQSRYGTYGHGGALLKADGSLHGTIPPYGPVNQAGIPANMAIVMGKKALLAGGRLLDPEIDPAIQRGSDFFAFYVNKGPIPYGEHEPYMEGHAPNGKDALCAVLFGLQDNRLVETEYFARMTTAGFSGREYGHTGQGFSYLWGALGANMGGALAVAEYLKPVRWHLDLERRTDGSFVYDGGEQYGAGKTADGTYLGASAYYEINPTASYILTYSLPLQRLYITGKNAYPANTLDAAKVANAIAAATFKQDCTGFSVTRLIAALSEFDPVVRNYCAIELATRPLLTTEVNTLLAMLDGANANGRQGACQTLGLVKNLTALPLIGQRLTDPDPWVRAKAATALRSYGSLAATQQPSQLTTMLSAFTANATDPDVIVWDDPIQIANGYLGFGLFGDAVYGGNNIATYTINASRSLLYPALKAGLKQPDSKSRFGVANFAYNYLTLTDVETLILDLFEVIETESQADTMWSMNPRGSGIATLAKHKISEGIPMALAMQEVPTGFGWGSDGFQVPGLNALAAYGDASRWTLPTLRGYLGTWDPTSSQYTTLVNTISSIENAITAPTQVPGLPVAYSLVVTTVAAKAITLTGFDVLGEALSYTILTQPAHGILTGTAPSVIYTPESNYSGVDRFTFRTGHGTSDSQPATVSLIVGAAGAGLKGEYYDNMDFTNLKVTRTDAQVNFDWGTGTPDAAVAADSFSARWSGLLLAPESGTYTFSTLNSDGVRLYINGVSLIDDYVDQTTNWKDGVSVNLTAGQMVDLAMEYYENTGSAVAKLKWSGPSFAGLNGLPVAREWLYDGSGVTERTAYAHAQSVTLVQNTARAIALTGSGANLSPLAYSIIIQPAHGTLTGIAPNLTYTPAAGFSGSDSFTFIVNNGTSNSAPATVSIAVWAGLPVDFFWTTAVSGNWSGATTWSNAAGAAAVPAATGQAIYRLSFNKSGTYTATQDLANGFLLNQLNVAGVVTLAGSNSLVFAANGSILPQFNQNSINTVMIGVPVSLTAMTTFGGTSGGQVTLQGLLSGTGGLTKNNAGTLQINNVTNTYSGGTIISSGIVSLGLQANGALGTGPVTLNNGGALTLERINATNPLNMNGGTIHSNNGFGNSFSGLTTLSANTTIHANWNMTFSGNISGAGGFTKTGPNTLTLSGTNSFTGSNYVTAGTLACSKSAALGTGPIDITGGAKVALNYTGTRQVAALTFNAGPAMPAGTYGSTASPATHKNDTYFSGTGTVTISPATTTTLALTGGSTPSDPGTPLTFTATVAGASPTGNVVFYAGATPLGTSALNGSYQASLTTGSLVIGLYEITARYAGNANNAASTSAAIAIEITSILPPPPTNLFAAPGNNTISLTWTVSTGASGYYVKRSLTSGGPYAVIGIPTTAGYMDLTATNGTSYHYVVSATNGAGESGNSSQVSVIPSPVASATTLDASSGASGAYDTMVTFTASVGVLGGPATGTVTFRDGATVLGTGTLAAGQAGFSTGTLATGGHAITATYGGDTTFAASASSAFSYTVTAKPLTITGVTAANKEYDGTAAAVLTGGGIPAGVVSGESVTVVAGAGAFASANAGSQAVTVTGYALAGTHAGNYVLSAQPAVPNATITARTLGLAGTRVYDGTATAAAENLVIGNKVDGDDITLAGSVELAGKDVGTQGFVTHYTAATRVQSATGNTGTSAAVTIGVIFTTTPVAGNTLIAVIATRGNSANRISGITQTGASWSLAAQATHASGTTTEIWVAPNVAAGAAKALTINQASLRSAAVLMEYSGMLAVSPLDRTNNATGTSIAAVTGTTAATAQTNELWIGGIGIADGRRALNAPYGNAFAVIASPKSGATSSDAMIYVLEKWVSATGTANTGGTVSTSDAWSGAIATFKTASTGTLTLTGTAAGNYTLIGMSGSVTITPKALTVTGLTASARDYDGTTAAALGGAAAFLTPEAAAAGTSGDGKPYTVDAVTPVGTAAGVFADADVGAAKVVIVTGVSVSGAGSGNYTVTQPAGLTADITVRALSISANNQSKTYGQAVVFGSGSTLFASSGLRNGETIGSVTLTCVGGGAAAEASGSPYPITPGAASGGTFSAGNYNISYVPGALTVNRADQTIGFGPLAARNLGDAAFELAAASDSGLTVSYGSSDPSVASVAGRIVTLLKAGTTTLTASQAGDGNHHPAIPVSQSLTVLPVRPPAIITLALTFGVTPCNLGAPLTFTATVTGDTPTGNVRFHAGARQIGTSALNGSYQASVTTRSLETASYFITASYDGDADNGPGASAPLAVEVTGNVAPKDVLTFVFAGLPATTISGADITLTVSNGTDLTALAPTYTLSAEATGIPVSGTVGNFATPQTYTVTAPDLSTKTYTVTVTSVNDAPVAAAQSVSTAEDTAKAIALTAGDVNGDALTYAIVTPPAHGTLGGSAPNVIYTPASDYHGADGFTFTANDGVLDSASATVSLTVTPVNDAPVANAQSVTAANDTAKPITLQATDVDADALSYAIVTAPAHGVLSGTPPNVTYTPALNYYGADGFTFKANDGTSDSAVATVSLNVMHLAYTWNSGATGNWSDITKWTAGSPATTGNPAYILNFNVTGTFATTSDLSAGFQLNQLNFGGSTVTMAGNSLAFSADGTTLPQVNQNGAVTVVIGNNLVLSATTTVGGGGSGTLTFSGAISGGGGLTKTSASQLTLSGTNTYSGPTTLNSGILRVTKPASLYHAVESNWTPANLTVANGATLRIFCGGPSDFTTAQAATMLGNLTWVNHNGLLAGSYFGFDTLNAAFLTTTVAANINDSSGPGGGAVGLRKYSNGTLLLAGANTYSGKTVIDAGTLSVASLNSVNGGNPPLANSNLGRPVTVAAGTVDFGNATSPAPSILIYTGTGETTDRVMNLAGQGVTNTVEQAGTGHLKFTSALTITGSGYNKTLVLKGSTAGTGEIAGSIIDPAVGKTTAITKSGTGTWTLSGANSHTGATQIQAGTLACASAAALGGGALDITTGAKLELNFSGTRQVASLTFNAGSAQPNGTYGSTASNATYKNDATFAGAGTVTVGPVVTLQYTLTVSATPSNGGSAAGAGLFNEGSLQTITATANNGWRFAGWTGSGITAPDAASTTVWMDANKTATANFSALDRFATWASSPAQGLTAGVNDGPNDDPDHDGITNLLEFTLGGLPMVSSRTILPVLTKSSGGWVFEYDRSALSLAPATTQVVEYGDDLTGWTAVTIPDTSAGIVSVTPGTSSDHVTVTIPSMAAMGFVRLKVTQ